MNKLLLRSLIVTLVVLTTFVSLQSTELQAQSSPESSPRPAKIKAHATTPEALLGVLSKDVGLAVGEKVPDFTVNDSEGRPLQWSTLLEKGPQVVVFYRGGWCPYCNHQLRALTEAASKFKSHGVSIVAISVDQPEHSANSKALYTIPFLVLSDPTLQAHDAFKASFQVDAPTLVKLEGFGIHIEKWSGLSHHKLAVPSIFIVGADGVVRWAHANPDYKTRPSVEQLLEVLSSLSLR